jgi:predicted lipoprotein with Yx(FWY)xxD motif
MRRLMLSAVAATLLLAPLALARPSAHPTLAAAHNSTLGQTIVVDGHGMTAYRLVPETTGSLLCTGHCLNFWFPVKVASKKTKLRAGHGVHGKLGLLHRSNGVLQVTLRGFPLYTFSGDAHAGDASGEGIQSFGGTWKALAAASGSGIAPAGQPTTPGTSSPTPPSTMPGPTPPYRFPGY